MTHLIDYESSPRVERGDGITSVRLTVMRILWVYGATEVTRTFTDTGETVTQMGRPSS